MSVPKVSILCIASISQNVQSNRQNISKYRYVNHHCCLWSLNATSGIILFKGCVERVEAVLFDLPRPVCYTLLILGVDKLNSFLRGGFTY